MYRKCSRFNDMVVEWVCVLMLSWAGTQTGTAQTGDAALDDKEVIEAALLGDLEDKTSSVIISPAWRTSLMKFHPGEMRNAHECARAATRQRLPERWRCVVGVVPQRLAAWFEGRTRSTFRLRHSTGQEILVRALLDIAIPRRIDLLR